MVSNDIHNNGQPLLEVRDAVKVYGDGFLSGGRQRVPRRNRCDATRRFACSPAARLTCATCRRAAPSRPAAQRSCRFAGRKAETEGIRQPATSRVSRHNTRQKRYQITMPAPSVGAISSQDAIASVSFQIQFDRQGANSQMITCGSAWFANRQYVHGDPRGYSPILDQE